jgi:hypothetical protein
MPNDGRLTFDAPDAFRLLGVSKNHGYSLIARGEFPLPVIRAGCRLLIPKVALERLLIPCEIKENDPKEG